MILLFKIFPNCSAEMLSSVPKHKKAVMCLMEKIFVLDKLRAGVVLLAVSSMLMNQYTFNRMSLK